MDAVAAIVYLAAVLFKAEFFENGNVGVIFRPGACENAFVGVLFK